MLCGCCRYPKAAYDEAAGVALALESIGSGAPAGFARGGTRALAAQATLALAGHGLWVSARVEAAWALLELGQGETCAAHAAASEVGPGSCCSPHQRMPCNSRHEGSRCIG
jgi:hypothetical protein